MEDVFSNPVQLSAGINLRDLITSQTEFRIDVDFNKQKLGPDMNDDGIFQLSDEDDGDSDIEDTLKNIEQSTEQLMLSSPEYHSFDELATKMVDCIPSGDAKILIIEEGDGPLVPVDAEVTIHYAAYWEKAKIPFDSTLTMNGGAPLRLCLGDGRILPGLEIGLTTVRGPTARFHLLLSPKLTWGERGAPPRILPKTALFAIVLYDVRDTQAMVRFHSLPMEEQTKFEVITKTVKSLHGQAKDFFARKKYIKAIKHYQQSISILTISRPKNDIEMEGIKKLKITSYVNLAVCYYKISKPKYVVLMCEALDKIIDVENHCKALFYYGRAYEMMGKMDDALVYYRKALKLEPKNKEIGKTLAALDESIKKSVKTEKEMWQNAFNVSVPEEKKDEFVNDVDEDFQNGVRDMCQDLAGRREYSKFDLPTGLTKYEVDCIKNLAKKFEGLIVEVEGEGKRKKVAIIKKAY